LWVAQQLNQSQKKTRKKAPFVWEAASVYFLMTDRLGTNDTNFNRTKLRENYVVLKEVLRESQKKLTKAILTN
jgi:hypothetical protein